MASDQWAFGGFVIPCELAFTKGIRTAQCYQNETIPLPMGFSSSFCTDIFAVRAFAVHGDISYIKSYGKLTKSNINDNIHHFFCQRRIVAEGIMCYCT